MFDTSTSPVGVRLPQQSDQGRERGSVQKAHMGVSKRGRVRGGYRGLVGISSGCSGLSSQLQFDELEVEGRHRLGA